MSAHLPHSPHSALWKYCNPQKCFHPLLPWHGSQDRSSYDVQKNIQSYNELDIGIPNLEMYINQHTTPTLRTWSSQQRSHPAAMQLHGLSPWLLPECRKSVHHVAVPLAHLDQSIPPSGNGNGIADAEGLLQRHERELCHHIHRCQRLLLQHHRPCFAFGVQESAVNPAWQRPNADLGNGRKSIMYFCIYIYIYLFIHVNIHRNILKPKDIIWQWTT